MLLRLHPKRGGRGLQLTLKLLGIKLIEIKLGNTLAEFPLLSITSNT